MPVIAPQGVSENQVKRWALDAGDWLWGTVKGCFNEKMTVSQIVVDAVIGVIPIVGDVTAARDLIAVITHLIKRPEKREEVMEWVLLVILLLALIPVASGLLKGVGRLATRGAKTAAESRGLLKEIITFLNRMGTGNAVKFIKELNLLKYERQVVKEFYTVVDHMTLALEKIEAKLGWYVPKALKDMIPPLKSGLKELRDLGGKMVPKAVKELHSRMKVIQQAIYEGELHVLSGGGKQVVYEAEARLVEKRAAELAARKMKYPQNPAGIKDEDQIAKYYKPKAGWPELMKEIDKRGIYSDIAAFHGEIRPTVVHGPTEIKRVVQLGRNGVTRPWWLPPGVTPKNARQWREESAVLDGFGHNGWIVTCHLPAGRELKAWEGTVASQIDKEVGQYLEGGGKQLFLDLGTSKVHETEMVKAFRAGKAFTTPDGLVFSISKTGWTDAVNVWGFGEEVERRAVQAQALAKYERQTKVALAGARAAEHSQSH